MQRIQEPFLHILEASVPLKTMQVLEMGCGDGAYSAKIAPRCKSLIGIDPDRYKLAHARGLEIPNAMFVPAPAQATGLEEASVDLTVFTLSFHHVFPPMMPAAIDEALRVTKPDGRIIFLEPGVAGSFFEAEIRFDAGDGDERGVKATAYRVMQEHRRLSFVNELVDETAFRFDSVDDFYIHMRPKKNLHEVDGFLHRNRFVLRAKRRINIYKPLPH